MPDSIIAQIPQAIAASAEYKGCSGFWGCFHAWQDFFAGILAFIAGVLGFGAAIWAVRKTLQSEARRAARELEALKTALGVEVRHFATNAFNACGKLMDKIICEDAQVTMHDIEDACRSPEPVIYPNNANLIGHLGDAVADLILFFQRIQVLKEGVARMRRNHESYLDVIGNDNVITIAAGLLEICENAVPLLPILKAGQYYGNLDAMFPGQVQKLKADLTPHIQYIQRNTNASNR